MQHERIYRAREPSYFKDGIMAFLDVDANVVTFDKDEFDIRVPRDLRMLRNLDERELYYLSSR